MARRGFGKDERPVSDIASRSWTSRARRPPPGRVVGRWVRLALGGVLLGGAAAAAARAVASLPSAPPPTKAVAPVESWSKIVKPVRVYGFEAPDLRALPLVYAARRHALGGGREDTIVVGAFGAGTPLLRFSLFRRAREAVDAVPLAVALARQAAEAGLSATGLGGALPGPSERMPDRLATRFGRVEVADLALASGPGAVRAAAGTAGKTCSGFRLALERPAFTLTGLACGAGGKPMPRHALGCLIERLDLAAARDDRELIDFFAASELRRDAGCAGMGLGPNAVHAAWLDDKSGTPRETPHRR